VPSLLNGIKVAAFASYSVKIHVIFGVQFERRKVDKKSKPTWKLKHANSILESFEYFCQISSKLIVTILSYTVSKLVCFLRQSVVANSIHTADATQLSCVRRRRRCVLGLSWQQISQKYTS